MTWAFTVQGVRWTVKTSNGLFSWPPLLAAATTMGDATVFRSDLCPDASSLAHEFYHVMHTIWFRYLLSYTIGRLWDSTYWKDEERAANAYQVMHAGDAAFVAAATTIRADMTKQYGLKPDGTPVVPTVTINHPV